MITKSYNKTKKVCKTTFSLNKEAVTSAKKVSLLGEFNGWNKDEAVEMKKSKDGSFQATVELPVGKKYEFRYLMDNGMWENDWRADDYVFVSRYNVHNSVVKIDALPTNGAKATTKATTAKKATKATTATTATTAKKTTKVVKGTKTVKATKTTNSKVKSTTKKADDLKKIEGVGPKIATLLNEAGIKTFANLADAKLTTLQSVLDKAGPRFKMHNPKTWAKQADLAAKGEWTKLDKLQKELNGGV